MVTSPLVRRGSSPLIEPNELNDWLEWAGSKLLAMSLPQAGPKEFRSAWPNFAQDAREAYGYSGEKLRPARPGSKEITLMDEILTFPILVTDVTTRRIINARCLVTPVSNRHLYSWSRIAELLHSDRRSVAGRYTKGLREIAVALPESKIDAVRHSMFLFSISS